MRARAQVMIAACDTFRSGAVEQLKTHCARLGVPLYERGYEKDPAKVAYEAQRAAERSHKDVLLVDTAGTAALPPSIVFEARLGALQEAALSPLLGARIAVMLCILLRPGLGDQAAG